MVNCESIRHRTQQYVTKAALDSIFYPPYIREAGQLNPQRINMNLFNWIKSG